MMVLRAGVLINMVRITLRLSPSICEYVSDVLHCWTTTLHFLALTRVLLSDGSVLTLCLLYVYILYGHQADFHYLLLRQESPRVFKSSYERKYKLLNDYFNNCSKIISVLQQIRSHGNSDHGSSVLLKRSG
jgi:hypothetical protein